MRSEPVLVLLNGIAGVVNLVLVALVVTGVLDMSGEAIAAVVAAIQGGANLVGAVIRAAVVSPRTADLRVAETEAALFGAVASHPANGANRR